MDTDFDYLKTQFGNPSNLSTIEVLTEGVYCVLFMRAWRMQLLKSG